MSDFALGKIQAALASATNEVTVAAANLNFDFSLVKCEAPAEYKPLSSILTSKRRTEAEGGQIHVIARRLAALFDGVCEHTPRLIRAYGTRASEICQNANTTNPTSSAKTSELFADYIGVDATSIWAAATSSDSGRSVHIHLLACLLARVWTASEAVSIWDEIIRERRREIASKFENDAAISYASLAAATQQDISLDQIAAWDASARAWLRTADRVKAKEHTQFNLINKELLPVNKEPTLYRSTIRAWISALETMERLLGGASYNIRDGHVMLAISAWHLYPDMVVYGFGDDPGGSTEVAMGDGLLAGGGAISLGLTVDKAMDSLAGVYWSMPLGRLKFYGNPIQRTRSLEEDGSRLNFSQLLQAFLGAMLSMWEVTPSNLAGHVDLIIKTCCTFERGRGENAFPAIEILRQPCQDYLQDEPRSRALLSLGSRRREFLGDQAQWPRYFGLSRSIVAFQGLLEPSIATNIALLNRICQNVALEKNQKLIFSGESTPNARGVLTCSWTIAPGLEYPESLQTSDHLHSNEFVHDGSVYSYMYGDTTLGAIYGNAEALSLYGSFSLRLADVRWAFDQYLISPSKLRASILSDHVLCQHLVFLSLLNQVYSHDSMDGATISCRILMSPLLAPWPNFRSLSPWVRNCALSQDERQTQAAELQVEEDVIAQAKAGLAKQREDELNLSSQILAVLCYFETGSVCISYLQDDVLDRCIGFSVGDSIYVRTKLLSDPWQGNHNLRIQQSYQYTRLFGNIGKPGLALITSPSELMVRSASLGSWKVCNYASFDGQVIDAFAKTSLHLNILEWSSPLQGDPAYGLLTAEASLVQAVISIHDRGVWVGDIDVCSALSHPSVELGEAECRPLPATAMDYLEAFKGSKIWVRGTEAVVVQIPRPGASPPEEVYGKRRWVHVGEGAIHMCSVDYWDEVLDLSRDASVLVIRCHGNWLARLGTLGILTARSAGKRIIVLPEACKDICWNCLTGFEDNREAQAGGQVICIL